MAKSRTFSGLRFQRHELPAGTSLTVALTRNSDQCGIYILEFTDGQRYVGLSINVTSRYASHSRRWADIAAVSFASCPQELLDIQESAVIAELERQRFIMRNIDKTGRVTGHRPLDMVIEHARQIEWLGGAKVGHVSPERINIAQQRARKRGRLESLLRHSSSDGAMHDAAIFIERVLPDPAETEARFWTLAAFPGTVPIAMEPLARAGPSSWTAQVIFIHSCARAPPSWNRHVVLPST